MKNNAPSKSLHKKKEKELFENIKKLPSWARPIVLKHLELYRQAINKVRIMEPETLTECLIESRHIVEHMVEEIKQEASRHGESFASRKVTRMGIINTLPTNTQKKQLKN